MSYSTSLDDLLGPDENNQPAINNNLPTMNNNQPINNNQPVNNNQIVDAILTELDNIPNTINSDISSGIQNIAMDGNVHIPPPQLLDTENLLKGETINKPSVSNVLNNAAFNKQKKQPFYQKHKKDLILLGSYILLTFIFSLHQMNRILFGFFPKLLKENGQISILGIALKTLLTSVFFGLIIFLI